jgi:hypothetical protein
MSKINAFRVINLNYNNNTMKIDDELFHFNGESTLLALRNGGGKSVIVQVMMAPFVNKRYRDLKDREFSGYFSSNIPTYILVEWKLEGEANFVLTGMMVRKRIAVSDEDSKDDLEIVNFIHEYRGSSKYDISNIPFVEIKEGRKKVKSFGNSKQLFEELKKDRNINFNYYDMSSPSQVRNYFDKLKEYKINYKEWESIIRRLNLKESGLSELFTDSKNVNGLVEKWFLKIVEDKLNKEDNKVKNFGEIVLKYIKQYKENKTKIDKRGAIEEFFKDAENIKIEANAFRECGVKTLNFENSIANLIALLKKNQVSALKLKAEINNNIENITEEIKDIRYEELSLKIYKYMDEKDKIEKHLQDINTELESEKRNKNDLEVKRNILECAKIYKEYQDFSREVQEIENQLEILKKKNQDLGPERNNLGYTLKNYYYNEKSQVEEAISAIEDKIIMLEQSMKISKENIKELNEKLNKFNREMGEIRHKVETFNLEEENFNRRYKEKLIRNITGYYDNSALIELELNYGKTLEDFARKIGELKKLVLDKEEEKKAKERAEKDKIERKAVACSNLSNLEITLSEYEKEIASIKDILRYIDFSEEKLFEREEIITEFNNKINFMEGEALKLTLHLEKEENQLRKLQTGNILELPSEIELEFQKRDIHIVYGMEWLKKNSNSKGKNERLVQNNPFIPYSLIMNSKDIEKLEKEPIENFTSYPILIVRKEDLEEVLTISDKKLITLDKINFLISFNNKLIDEVELKKLIEEKKLEISVVQSKLEDRKKEIKFYEDKRNRVNYSNLEKEKYFDAKSMEKTLEEEVLLLDKELFELRKFIDALNGEIKGANSSLKEKEQQESDLRRKIEAFKELKEKYRKYCSNKVKKESLEEELENIRTNIIDEEANEKKSSSDKAQEEDRRRVYISKDESIKKKLTVYESYKEGNLVEKDIEDIEARYESLTNTITEDERSLGNRLSQASNRFRNKEKELTGKQNEYSLEEKHFRDEQYDSFKERQLKEEIKSKEYVIQGLNRESNKSDKDRALVEQKINIHEKNLKDKFDRERPKARDEIIEVNFDEKISHKEYEKKKLQEDIDKLSDKIRLIENNKSALAEYDVLPIIEELELKVDYVNLDKYRGELVRDYKESLEVGKDSKANLDKEIERILRKELFYKDDFFKKPLDKLEELSQDPEYLLDNLNITISSYKNLMEKLNADIELINKEKENVLQSLFDYIYEVHENIGKIDRNSSVNIRGRSIKMLRIMIPVWEDNIGLYRLKLNDLLDRVTAAALERLDKNENVEEIISTEITTKNLYNEVVSISSVEIKLYKIEEEKEYPISWDDVAKNSGGEGFLSAFVILSSLLSYMRRDDTDIFAEKESGKVLVMDNPFAQTSAEHLLKPLIEIAKKSNTQLICLSGLGGDSIYNRFENIYVLNLISSKLKGGIQFVRGDHLKGEEDTEVLISSSFKITEEIEQMELF